MAKLYPIAGAAHIAVAVALPLVFTGHARADQLEDAHAAFMKQDCATALNLWSRLAEQGSPAAETGLGILYEGGCGVPKDEKQAVDWYGKAADQGDAEAEYRLGMKYVMGSSVLGHDVAKGLSLMTKAGDGGNTSSLRALGNFYHRGWFGVEKDEAQSFTWYLRAANLGDPIAEEWIGNAYRFGTGVGQNDAEAADWYQKANEQWRKNAEQGDVPAELALGSKYETGLSAGIKMDKAAALDWYRKAAQTDGPLKAMAQQDVERVEKAISGSADDAK